MGLGYNFANTFECYSIFEEIKKPEEQITLWGNSIPTQKMIKNLKKYGFKTIRLPITWINFIDEMGNIDSNWIFYIKQIIDFVVKDYNMYCIINVHNDCKDDNWLSKGINAKNMFIKLWSQISKEFINYDEHLIFESMDNPSYYNSESIYDFETLLILNQAFIDTVRNSGGNNRYRLLLIPSGNSQINYFSFNYRIPNDSYNKFALSTNYFNPYDFCGGNTDNWGSENDYKEMFTEFEILKIFFVDKKIPVIISQAGVMTENNKEKESIREYLYFLFSLSLSLNGMISCLWDTSTSDYKYYDRVNDIWFDEEIKNNFKKISKGKFIKPTDFSFISNIETLTTINSLGHMRIKIGSRKTIRAIFNIKLTTKYPSEVGFGIGGFDKDENWIDIEVSGDEGKKQYDGSYTYDIDISYKGFNNFIELQKWWGHDYIIFNTFSIEYEKTYTLFDFSSYQNEKSNN
jgi:endoglucanase